MMRVSNVIIACLLQMYNASEIVDKENTEFEPENYRITKEKYHAIYNYYLEKVDPCDRNKFAIGIILKAPKIKVNKYRKQL